MGKKKPVKANNPDALKEAGNKAFAQKNYSEAVKQYTMAIEISQESPNHIYFANRANAYLEMGLFEECIADCNQAMQIDPMFPKSYYRKAKAQVNLQKLTDAMETLKAGLEKNPDNEDFKTLMANTADEIEQDNVLPPDHPERKRFNTLLDWMSQRGSDFSKLKLRYYAENYRGVHAQQNIKDGETILYVPLPLIITLEMAFKSPIGKLMYEKGLRQRLISPKHSFLGTYLLQERKKDPPPFAEYLDILPKSLSDFPIFFTEDEKAWLKGSPFLDQVNEKVEDIKIDYNLICKEVPEFKQFSIKEYSEVRMIVSSRIFGISVNGVKTDGFVPYADMLNHKRPRQTTWFYSDEREGFIIQACEDIPRGEQVFDSYGKKCNSRFFLNYGFINLDNDANEVPIQVPFHKEDPLFEIKLKLINEQRPWMKFRVVDTLGEKIMYEFISWLRYVEFEGDAAVLYLAKNEAISEAQKKRQNQQADSDDSDDVDLSDCFKAKNIKPWGLENEIKVWRRIDSLVDASLAKYETTYQEDLDLLAKDDQEKCLTYNQRNCVLFRSGEKKILHFLKDAATTFARLTKMSQKDAKKEVNQMKDFDQCLDYFKNCILPNLPTQVATPSAAK